MCMFVGEYLPRLSHSEFIVESLLELLQIVSGGLVAIDIGLEPVAVVLPLLRRENRVENLLDGRSRYGGKVSIGSNRVYARSW